MATANGNFGTPNRELFSPNRELFGRAGNCVAPSNPAGLDDRPLVLSPRRPAKIRPPPQPQPLSPSFEAALVHPEFGNFTVAAPDPEERSGSASSHCVAQRLAKPKKLCTVWGPISAKPRSRIWKIGGLST